MPGPTIYELNARGEQRPARDIPRLVAAGVGITWRAGRRELITMAALELLSGAGVAPSIRAPASAASGRARCCSARSRRCSAWPGWCCASSSGC